MATPYLTSDEARAVTKRLEKNGLMNPTLWVQLVPATLPESTTVSYVLRYYATQDEEQPIALVRFLVGGKKSKSTVFIDQLQAKMEQEETRWAWGEFKPNVDLVRLLPTVANTRCYKLQLLIGAAV